MPRIETLLPGLVFFHQLGSDDAFVPLSLDPARHAAYQAGKLATNVTVQNKQIAQALSEMAWDDFKVIFENCMNCSTREERQKACWDLVEKLTFATVNGDTTTSKGLIEIMGHGGSSAMTIKQYRAAARARAELAKAVQNATQDFENLPAGLKELAQGVSQLMIADETEEIEKPMLSLVLRLRGPKAGERAVPIGPKPPIPREGTLGYRLWQL